MSTTGIFEKAQLKAGAQITWRNVMYLVKENTENTEHGRTGRLHCNECFKSGKPKKSKVVAITYVVMDDTNVRLVLRKD